MHTVRELNSARENKEGHGDVVRLWLFGCLKYLFWGTEVWQSKLKIHTLMTVHSHPIQPTAGKMRGERTPPATTNIEQEGLESERGIFKLFGHFCFIHNFVFLHFS